jgi:hypothetical protein
LSRIKAICCSRVQVAKKTILSRLDEKHTRIRGQEAYFAPIVAGECIYRASVSLGSGGVEFRKAYGCFKEEALKTNLNYKPESVNIDGWEAT